MTDENKTKIELKKKTLSKNKDSLPQEISNVHEPAAKGSSSSSSSDHTDRDGVPWGST